VRRPEQQWKQQWRTSKGGGEMGAGDPTTRATRF